MPSFTPPTITANSAAYTSGTPVYGGLIVRLHRGSTDLGQAILESANPEESTVKGSVQDELGAENKWWLVTGPVEGSATIQVSGPTAPTLVSGDYFDAAIRVDVTGSGKTERWVIYNPGISKSQAGDTKQPCSIKLDKNYTVTG